MKIKLKKTLFIGIGGTGIDAILKSKKCFIDTYGEVPPMIGFLAIDTDNGSTNKSLYSNKNEVIKLDRSELLICSVQNPLAVYLQNKNNFEWVPPLNVKTINAISGAGAGQVRSNGRFIARYNHKTISSHIAATINKINALLPIDSPYIVELNQNGIIFPTIINIVSSIAGGTGSGMIIDIMAIIHETFHSQAQEHTIYPWIILPDVFRSMNSGPAMANVFYNTYGALRDLDYIMHLTPDNVALDFGYTTINESPSPIAFLINNVNTNGTAFDKIDDLTDILGRSMYLPSNEMGNAMSSPFDNIITNRNVNPNYKILDKQGWVASTGSAELIYDNKAITEVYCLRIINQICGSLYSYGSGGSNEANNFVDHPDVYMRENEGHNDVINSLLGSPDAPYTINIDINTTENNINDYINDCTLKIGESQVKTNFNEKLRSVKTLFGKKTQELIDSPNGINLVKNFISSLKIIIDLCRKELIAEKQELDDFMYPIDWSKELLTIRNSGFHVLRNPINEERLELLTEKVYQRVKDKRDALRREWAKKFYDVLENEEINPIELKVQNIELKIKNIEEKNRQELIKRQQFISSTSKFQIFLHKEEIMSVTEKDFDTKGLVLKFIDYMKSYGGVSTLIDMTDKQIESCLRNFANTTSIALDIQNLSISQKLMQMDQEKVVQYLERLINLSAPLWTSNYQGISDEKRQLDNLFIIGIEEGVQSQLTGFFGDIITRKEKTVIPNYVSTHQKDKIVVMTVQCLLPVFAINNFNAYESENLFIKGKSTISNYIDEKWKARMEREDFSIRPSKQKNNVLELWVYGFIFGYIHFDEEKKEYWAESFVQGSPIKDYRFPLGRLRDEAYDNFRLYFIYKEVEEKINKKIVDEGQLPIQSKLKEIKGSKSYNKLYSQLSRNERVQLDQANFSRIKTLFESEIDFMTKN